MVQTAERLVSTDAERYLLIYMVLVLLLVTFLIITFFIVFQKRKNKLLIQRMHKQRQFEEEITKTALEIKEQTLKNIGWELHDNVGQLLSVATMQLNVISNEVPEDTKQKFEDTRDVIKKSLQEVRALSKSLNSEVIQNVGLEKSIQNELNRFNKLKFVIAELKINGETGLINAKDEIIIFRIMQEFFSNSIKYSKAEKLLVTIDYFEDRVEIRATDDGVGFDMETVEKGSGLINMQSRARLIGAEFSLNSSINEGVFLNLSYPIKNMNNE